jgi:uncharacterized repeat protein (TIGR03803 family)
MSASSWFSGTFSHIQARRAKRRDARNTLVRRRSPFRPSPEALETRITLSLTTLASFNGTNGAAPDGALVRDCSGNMYGTTSGGGASSNGTVFELTGGGGPTTVRSSGLGSSTGAGASQTFTVAAQNSVGTTDTTYVGTVDFASTDSTANLPASDTFTASGNGTHHFRGFVLNKKDNPSIMATGTRFSSITVGRSVGVS